MSQPKTNAYVCNELHFVVTVDTIPGTTSMFINCPHCEKEGKHAMAQSRMYNVNQSFNATHEWYKPAVADWQRLKVDITNKGVIEAMELHVQKGGLLLRLKA